MHLIRWGAAGAEFPGVLLDGVRHDCSALVADFTPTFFRSGGQWAKGKSCDTFAPTGPCLVTTDEIPNVNALSLELDVNGVRRQSGSTASMVFDPCFLVHYLSQFMTLEAGDLIATGTPPGVGMGMTPPTFLVAGDVVELRIQHLGAQRQRFRPA